MSKMTKSIKIGNLTYHDVSPITGMIECKCRVGDGWQGVTKLTLWDYDDTDTLIPVAEADCRLGAHQDGAWWLILVAPVGLVPDVVEQSEINRFVKHYLA